MKIIKKLPHWVLSNPNPSFYETEGGTVLEQTGIMYKKVQELIENYNSFVTDVNNEIDEFISNSLADQEEFELKINQMIYDFTTLVDLELKNQDKEIQEAKEHLINNLNSSVQTAINNLFNSGRVSLNFEYNNETEELDITGIVLAEEGE